jgi:hypothetical protein
MPANMQDIITDLSDHLTASDKRLVACLYDVTPQYIDMLLRNARATNSETAQRIIKDLDILANINILTDLEKLEILKAA